MSVILAVPIPDELIPMLERKARNAGLNQEDYVRSLVSRDLSGPERLDEVLQAFREQVAASGTSDPELTALFSTARDEVYRSKNS